MTQKIFYGFCIDDSIWLSNDENYVVGIVTGTDLENQRVELSSESPPKEGTRRWYDLSKFPEFGIFHQYVPQDFYKNVGMIIKP